MVQRVSVRAGEPACDAVSVDEVVQHLTEAREVYRGGDPGEAAALLARLAERAPWHAETHLRLGISLSGSGRPWDACVAFRKALALDPDLATAHHGLASALLVMARGADALPHIERALELEPDNAEIRSEAGGVYVSLGRMDDALAAFERAAELRPDWPTPLHNQAMLSMRSGDADRVEALIRRADEAGTALPRVRMFHGMRHLERGAYAEGWGEYEWRWAEGGGKPPMRAELGAPLWDGTPLGDRTLLLWCEQGLGDTLQFARFASLVPKEGGQVVVLAPEPLASLVATCPGVDRVVTRGDTVEIDLQFPLMSLPYLLNAEPHPIPPYFSPAEPCPDADAAIERGLAFNVGIVWMSGRLYANHASRDCPLELFAALAMIPGVRLYSLQYGDAAAELANCSAPIIDLSPVLGNFHKTAAFVKRLDLIITVDTSLAHLAGAIGAPTWTLIPRNPDWRWMRDREDSPWYGTMRLYRQETAGDWQPVMERIARDLRELAAAHADPAAAPVRTVEVVRRPKPAATIFIKQYGEQRTGTNYIRAALRENYPDVESLVHIMGDKHGAPVPLDELRREAALQPDPALSFVTMATWGCPALATRTSNQDQFNEMCRLARPILEAYDRGDLRYVISTKEPYAWAVSIGRSYEWIAGSMELPAGRAGALARMCRRYNRSYRAWLALADADPERTFIVRHEDIVRDAAAVFARMEEHFGLRRAAPEWRDVHEKVEPVYWDGWDVTKSERFDRDFYRGRRYLEQIPPELRDVITRTIDWDLCARLGYAPLQE